jgi:hypothetical protein
MAEGFISTNIDTRLRYDISQIVRRYQRIGFTASLLAIIVHHNILFPPGPKKLFVFLAHVAHIVGTSDHTFFERFCGVPAIPFPNLLSVSSPRTEFPKKRSCFFTPLLPPTIFIRLECFFFERRLVIFPLVWRSSFNMHCIAPVLLDRRTYSPPGNSFERFFYTHVCAKRIECAMPCE